VRGRKGRRTAVESISGAAAPSFARGRSTAEHSSSPGPSLDFLNRHLRSPGRQQPSCRSADEQPFTLIGSFPLDRERAVNRTCAGDRIGSNPSGDRDSVALELRPPEWTGGRVRRPVHLVRVRLLDVSRGRLVGFAAQHPCATRLQVDVSLDRWQTQVAARLLLERLTRNPTALCGA
jgi:hypothetical protein